MNGSWWWMKERGKSTRSTAATAQLPYFRLISSLCWQDFSRRDWFQYALSCSKYSRHRWCHFETWQQFIAKVWVWGGQMIIWTYPIAPAGNKSFFLLCLPVVSKNSSQPAFAEKPVSKSIMFVSQFLQSCRAWNNMSVRLRVEKAQLILLLSSSKAITQFTLKVLIFCDYCHWHSSTLSYFHCHVGINIK